MSDRAKVSEAFIGITALLTQLQTSGHGSMTPRQQQGMKGAEACVMLCAHPGELDLDEIETLARAGLIFGAVLAGER